MGTPLTGPHNSGSNWYQFSDEKLEMCNSFLSFQVVNEHLLV